MTKHTWQKDIIAGRQCLVPACRDAEEWLAKTKLHQGVLIDPRRPRNIQHHRKLFALLNLAVDNWPHPTTTEALLNAIKIYAGHTTPVEVRLGFLARLMPDLWKILPEPIQRLTGKVFVVHMPKSISFESLSQDEFEPFYKQAVLMISQKLGVDIETLEQEAA